MYDVMGGIDEPDIDIFPAAALRLYLCTLAAV